MLLSIFERSAAHNIVDMIAQIAATAVFLAMFALIITEKIEKYMSALICGGVTLIVVLALIIMRCDSDSGKKLIKSMVLRTADRQGMC